MAIVQTTSTSNARLWASWVLSGIAILFLLFDSTIHLMVPSFVVEACKQLGIPVDLSVIIGSIEIACVILYVIPATSVLGAILLTGFLGGAIAIQMRINAPLFSTNLFPVYVGILIWGGLYLRETRLRELIPFRK